MSFHTASEKSASDSVSPAPLPVPPPHTALSDLTRPWTPSDDLPDWEEGISDSLDIDSPPLSLSPVIPLAPLFAPFLPLTLPSPFISPPPPPSLIPPSPSP